MKTLKNLRTEARLPLRAVAAELDVSLTFVAQIETGAKALPERLIGPLSEVLGVSESDIRRACPPSLIRIGDLTLEQRAAIADYAATIRSGDSA